MRADRLLTALLLLQERGRVTAAQLATELGVSLATARRDLEALSAAGIPVYPQPGRYGGWQLVGGARTDLSGLSGAEARALFLLAGPAAATSPDATTALRKLLRALPETFRPEARAAAGATLVDPAGWGQRDRDRPPDVLRLQDAVVRQQVIQFVYKHVTREAEPWGLIDKDGIWYLVAGTDRGQRTFRVDRIGELAVTERTFEGPPGFVLDEAWTQLVGTIEEKRSRAWATVLIPERFRWVLQDHFGRHCHAGPALEDGRVQARVGAPTARDIARTLSGWGSAVEVIEPPEVRAELTRIGSELVALYEDSGEE